MPTIEVSGAEELGITAKDSNEAVVMLLKDRVLILTRIGALLLQNTYEESVHPLCHASSVP